MTDTKGDGLTASHALRQQAVIRWTDSGIKASFANSVKISRTQEEIALNFGLNRTWDRPQRETHIELTNRVILNPFTAKRLAILFMAVIQQYEARYGQLDIARGRPVYAPTRGPQPSGQLSEPNLPSVKR
jgi:uncharacterized protein DUF3467